MPATGDTCQQSGLYSGTCSNHHVKQIALSKGERFPPCNTGTCSGAVIYTLKTATK
jgi:hypothetical protein